MKKVILIGLINLFVFNCYSQKKNIYLVFDNDVPDSTPKVYANSFFRKDSSYIGYCSFSNTEKCFYYAVTNREWDSSRILKLSPDGKIDTVKFNINKNWEGEPYITPDGQRMYFTAVKPPKEHPWHADIYYMDKTEQGWGKPTEFSLNSPKSEWHISSTKHGTVYFGSERDAARLKADLYYAVPENGTYKTAIKLPYPINSDYNDCDPLIAPDESYLIFHSDRPGGCGEHDLYITQ
jgi:Tol biopolymer transport system component